MTFPLGNATNTLNALNGSSSNQRHAVYKKPELPVMGRSNSREQKTSSSSTKENSHSSYPSLTAEEILAKKKEFSTYKFYLDNLEPTTQKRIERGIKLLGAEQENFFSNKCTHVITAKPIPAYDNLLQSSSNHSHTNQSKKSYNDKIVDNAIQWNLVLWSVEVMWKTIEFFLRSSCANRKETQEKRALGKALQEEKLYGLATGANNDAQTKRPQFVPFTGHFLLLEDADQVHRPPVMKQFTRKTFTQPQSDYPWPTLKSTPKHKSPFLKRPPPPPSTEQTAEKPLELYPHDDKENIDPNLKITPPKKLDALTKVTAADYSQQFTLRASGFQPYTNTAQSISTRSVMTNENGRRLPPGDNLTHLNKRMIENITQQKELLQQQQQKEQQLQKEQLQQQKRKKDARFCENCNMLFESLEEHYKEKTHQTFIRDQNNFKQLDQLFEKTRRVYKSPLPDFLRSFTDPHIDGKDVQFTSTTAIKRGHPSPPEMLSKKQKLEPQIAQHENKGWGQYHDVFL